MHMGHLQVCEGSFGSLEILFCLDIHNHILECFRAKVGHAD